MGREGAGPEDGERREQEAVKEGGATSLIAERAVAETAAAADGD